MTEQEERDDRRRKYLALLLLLLIATTEDTFRGYSQALAVGALSPYGFSQNITATLIGAHAQAGYIGRNLAGLTQPMGPDDYQFGKLITAKQTVYLQQFVNDIQFGRYDEQEPALLSGFVATKQLNVKAIEARAALYAMRLRGSAYQAWAVALPPDTLVWWRLGPVKETHCHDCPRLAQKGPYRADMLPTYPGAGSTECLVHCKCHLEAEGFGDAFVSVELDDVRI